ncbi:hypothetical protein [Luteococcus sanguinis]|uniref:Uncharacterized protein n=1 Tax=Luteococcus sanguinis TaxID=174038 RepID=A0ABW1X1F7_9ACTN
MNLDTAIDAWAVEHGVDPDSFTIDGDRNETYCLLELGNGDCEVFYSERGYHRSARIFVSRDAALAFLKQWLLGDPTTRKSFRAQHQGPG